MGRMLAARSLGKAMRAEAIGPVPLALASGSKWIFFSQEDIIAIGGFCSKESKRMSLTSMPTSLEMRGVIPADTERLERSERSPRLPRTHLR